ncbi:MULTISPECIES: sulfotransferase [unclassified Streptomyces]|uniref:sulfotransferase n=1 Tax=unclassified Streptomyces TaxID=2593676 RepID=UPI002815DC77|nr:MULTISPECIES: sulfotransferase [unclassified Streptomyces]
MSASVQPAPTRPVFVLGRSRSGTTLVQPMLHARPRIALPPETLPHGLKGAGAPTCSPPTKDGRPSAIWRTGGHLDHQADARSDTAERGRIGAADARPPGAGVRTGAGGLPAWRGMGCGGGLALLVYVRTHRCVHSYTWDTHCSPEPSPPRWPPRPP